MKSPAWPGLWGGVLSFQAKGSRYRLGMLTLIIGH